MMPNLPSVVAYHTEICVRTANKQNSKHGYVLQVDLPDYYSDSEIFNILAKQFDVNTVGGVINNLIDGSKIVDVDGFDCRASIKFTGFDNSNNVYDFNDAIC